MHRQPWLCWTNRTQLHTVYNTPFKYESREKETHVDEVDTIYESTYELIFVNYIYYQLNRYQVFLQWTQFRIVKRTSITEPLTVATDKICSSERNSTKWRTVVVITHDFCLHRSAIPVRTVKEIAWTLKENGKHRWLDLHC